MYKIKYLKTGHVFLLPDNTAQDLQKEFPYEYQVLEINGKKVRAKKTVKEKEDEESILSKVLDKS